jgi:serine/threonine-protein kinase
MPSDDLIGTLIADRFDVLAQIGEGGMGTVYRARQRSIERDVAIKVLKAQLSRDAKVRKRFEREARLASKLAQPNTVSIIDHGMTGDGRLYIAMELIEGRTLLDVQADDGKFAVDRVVRIGSQLCDALEAAHALGIVHRDLKPDNVIILDRPPGRDLLKVLDFGLAKLFGERATSSGVVGTPRYVAPEVATGGKSMPASDVYAVGVILAELALGRPLYNTDNLYELVALKVRPEPEIARVPQPLRRAIGAMLAPDPAARATAAQARTLLRAVADGSVAFPVLPPQVAPASPVAPVATRQRVRRPFVVLLLAAALVGAAGYAYAYCT